MGGNMPPLTHPQPAVGPAKVRRSGATRCGEMREVSWDEVPLGCLPAWERLGKLQFSSCKGMGLSARELLNGSPSLDP